jgi:hypothetical protein
MPSLANCCCCCCYDVYCNYNCSRTSCIQCWVSVFHTKFPYFADNSSSSQERRRRMMKHQMRGCNSSRPTGHDSTDNCICVEVVVQLHNYCTPEFCILPKKQSAICIQSSVWWVFYLSCGEPSSWYRHKKISREKTWVIFLFFLFWHTSNISKLKTLTL